jgi:manganese/zinc/iron transport system substrate-binding protein
MRRRTILFALLLALVASGCDGGDSAHSTTQGNAGPAAYPYNVVTTVGMVTDIVQQVAGDKAKVTGLIGAGIDPHLYQPTRNDVAALLEADVVFYSGLMLEGKMTDTFVKIARGGKPVHAVTELIDESLLLQPAAFQGHFDPHVWMDVSKWMKAVEVVAGSLAEYDAANAAFYHDNAQRYLSELRRLDQYAKRVVDSVPKRQRLLVTAHDAFNYFGQAYNLDVRGIQGISTESEAGLQDINRLVEELVKHDVRAVFVESSVAEKNVRALIDGARARGKEVKIGGSLYSDAMGSAGTYEGTYVGMIDHNATIIARALGGEAPERGMNGKLSN